MTDAEIQYQHGGTARKAPAQCVFSTFPWPLGIARSLSLHDVSARHEYLRDLLSSPPTLADAPKPFPGTGWGSLFLRASDGPADGSDQAVDRAGLSQPDVMNIIVKVAQCAPHGHRTGRPSSVYNCLFRLTFGATFSRSSDFLLRLVIIVSRRTQTVGFPLPALHPSTTKKNASIAPHKQATIPTTHDTNKIEPR